MGIIAELKRRNVFKVAVAYVIVGWVILQIVDTVAPGLGWPEWVMSFFIVLIGMGLPIALLFAWAFELTPDGLKREGDVYRGSSTTKKTGQKINYLIIGGLVLAIGGLGYDRMSVAPEALVDETPVTLNRASIAVLAFADLSPAGDQEYFGDGISESLLNVLAKIDELSVSSRTSSFAFKGKDRNVTDIANILNVAHVLEGSVKKAGNRVLITAQLIDGAENRHLWSDTYERELTTENIFAIQAEIADAIVEALSEELGVGLESDVSSDPLTANMDAYELYLQAKKVAEIESVATTYRLIELLERAVELDPEFVEAWAMYAQNISWLPGWDHALEEAPYLHRGIEAAERALAIDPTNIIAYEALVTSYFELHEWEKGYDIVIRARLTVPNFKMRAEDAMGLGYLQEAYTQALSITKDNPEDSFHHLIQGLYFEAIGDDRGAINKLKEAILKGYKGMDENLVQAYWNIGDTAPWIAYTSQVMLDKDPELLPFLPHLYDLKKASTKSKPEAIKRFKAIIRQMGFNVDGFLKKGPRWHLRIEEDIAVLLGGEEKVVDQYWSNTPMFWMWTPDLHDFRQTEAFRSRVRSSGMLAYWQKHGWPDLCRAKGNNDFVCD